MQIIIIVLIIAVVVIIIDSVLFWIEVPGAHVALLSKLVGDSSSNLRANIICC